MNLNRLFTRRRQSAPEIDVLGLVPVRKVAERLAEDSENLILLDPRFKKGPLGRWLQPRLDPERAFILVRLDAMGSYVWRQIDGHRNIEAIIRSFVEAFPDQRDDAAERVWKFLHVSNGHGLINW